MGLNYKEYLQLALQEAQIAFDRGSVPIGALILNSKGEILAKGYNETKITNDPTAHAEVVCMRHASEKIIRKFNPEPTFLFTTLEPCFACSFFITRTNIEYVVWASNDPHKGGIEYLKESEKMKEDISKLKLTEEPFAEIKLKSKELMFKYYLIKNDMKTANLFK